MRALLELVATEVRKAYSKSMPFHDILFSEHKFTSACIGPPRKQDGPSQGIILPCIWSVVGRVFVPLFPLGRDSSQSRASWRTCRPTRPWTWTGSGWGPLPLSRGLSGTWETRKAQWWYRLGLLERKNKADSHLVLVGFCDFKSQFQEIWSPEILKSYFTLYHRRNVSQYYSLIW